MTTLLRKKVATDFSVFVACGNGLNEIVAEEIREILSDKGDVKIARKGVFATTNLEGVYRIAAFCKTGSRLMIQVHHCKRNKHIKDPYDLAREIDWTSVFHKDSEFSCSVTSVDSNHNTQYFNLKLKDAIVDNFRDKFGTRPNVSKEVPSIRIYLHLDWKEAFFYVDPFGPLHERGYREQAGLSPMKETLAAAMIRASGFCQNPLPLIDPFCGSGTIPIEAALAFVRAPNQRISELKTLNAWLEHQPATFRKVFVEPLDEVRDQAPVILGSDQSDKILPTARGNAVKAGIADLVKFEQREVKDCIPFSEKGYIVCNPPYGERFRVEDVIQFYRDFFFGLKKRFPKWKLVMISSNTDAMNALSEKPDQVIKTKTGPISAEIRIYTF